MQPIILLAALVVGGGLISTGFLAGTNEFEIWVQDLGFAEDEIKSPFEHVNVDFEITKTPVDPDDIPNTGDEFFKNEIIGCSFHTFDDVDNGATIICKLFSWKQGSTGTSIDDRVVVCEGRVVVGGSAIGDPPADYVASDTFIIPREMEAYVGACDVQNIDFVKIVATGKEPMSAFCDFDAGFTVGNDTNMNGMYEPWGADDDEGNPIGTPDEAAAAADNETCDAPLPPIIIP